MCVDNDSIRCVTPTHCADKNSKENENRTIIDGSYKALAQGGLSQKTQLQRAVHKKDTARGKQLPKPQGAGYQKGCLRYSRDTFKGAYGLPQSFRVFKG